MTSPTPGYGTLRERAASVSFAEIDAAARKLMTAGDYPSVAAVRGELGRGSTTTISEAMRRFWKDQAALNSGNPVALTRLPPEFADAAVDLWEQALRLSLQTAKSDDNAARARLEDLKRETESRARSVELREKEWDMAARVRERALSDTRDQVNLLLKELANATAEIRARDARIADLHGQLEENRRQLATLTARVFSKSRSSAAPKSRRNLKKPKAHAAQRAGRSPAKRKPRLAKKKSHGRRR
ncbi:MAG: DNA-binding protein [Terriglobia bacterium]|nr:DNA-binding protein [Terriglobia bacterium]